VALLYPQALSSFFIASYDSQGYGLFFDSPDTVLGQIQKNTPFFAAAICHSHAGTWEECTEKTDSDVAIAA
jgi:hypothetical protein